MPDVIEPHVPPDESPPTQEESAESASPDESASQVPHVVSPPDLSGSSTATESSDGDPAADDSVESGPSTEVSPDVDNSTATSSLNTTSTVSGPTAGADTSTSDSASTPPISSADGATPPNQPTFGQNSWQPPKQSKKRLLIFASAVAVILLLAVGYVFAFYLPNQPSHLYGEALTNSGKAVDQLINYSKQQEQANYKSWTLNGFVHVKSGRGSYDVGLNGTLDKNLDSTIQTNIDTVGEKVNVNARTVVASGNTTPDVYFQVTGIKPLLDGFGLKQYDYLDSKWIVIDHTVIETYESDLKQAAGGGAGANVTPTATQVQDALNKAQAVNKQYLFTTNSSTAVLTNEKFLGTSTMNGHTIDHFKVGYNKAHLEAYVAALGKAVDNSQLNQWAMAADNKNLSQLLHFDSLGQSIKQTNAKYTFDLWADAKTRLVSKVSFADPTDNSQMFSVAQNYTGGSQYPFVLTYSGKDGSSPDSGTATLLFNTRTHVTTFGLVDTEQSSGSTTTSSADFTLTPSDKAVTVTAPKGAESINNLLLSLGLGNLPSHFTSTASPLSSHGITE